MSADKRQGFILECASQADILSFIPQLIRYSRLRQVEGEERGFLSDKEIEPLGHLLFERLDSQAIVLGTDIVAAGEDEFGDLAYTIISTAAEVTRNALRQRLNAILNADPNNATSLLKRLAGRTHSSGGVVHVSDISDDTYASICKLLDPDEVYSQLIKTFGNTLEDAKWVADWDHLTDVDLRVATQFAAIHKMQALPKNRPAQGQ